MNAKPESTDMGALSRRAPRYTSYPTAPHFTGDVGPDTVARWLSALPEDPVSLYLHVPFCDTLCYFCACRTQGSTRSAPVSRYLDFLGREIEDVARQTPDHLRIAHMHWGGGSPTVLSPGEITDLYALLRETLPLAPGAEVAVEIDPRDMTEARLDAFAAGGVNRASIGVQDFDRKVQATINRMQGWEMTRDVIGGLRARGVKGINVDALYGLPFQTEASLGRTLEQLIGLAPDRVALYGYAHVPWMARRQRAIPEEALPDGQARLAQSALAVRLLTEAGYVPVGIDHFALPGDGLAKAAAAGTLRRNFQGYTDDSNLTLIGLGASAISRLPQGYAQNAPVTADYQNRVAGGALPVVRGRAMTLDDRMRAHVIERLMCDFRFDGAALTESFGDFAAPCLDIAQRLMEGELAGCLAPRDGGFEIRETGRNWTRLVASAFDAYFESGGARHSRVI